MPAGCLPRPPVAWVSGAASNAEQFERSSLGGLLRALRWGALSQHHSASALIWINAPIGNVTNYKLDRDEAKERPRSERGRGSVGMRFNYTTATRMHLTGP